MVPSLSVDLMKAMLLAAGIGSRLRPLTDHMPKCMVPVGGVPLVERTVHWLRDSGITDLCINLHAHPQVVRRHFGDGSAFGVRLRYAEEPTLLGTAGAVGAVRTWLADAPFLVIYADNLIRCDLTRVRALHERTHATATIALFWREDVTRSGMVVLDTDDRILRFVEKPSPQQAISHWVSAGLLLCDPRVLRFIGAPPTDFGYDVLPALLAAGEQLIGYRMGAEEPLHWIDTPDDLARTERHYQATHPDRPAPVSQTLRDDACAEMPR